MALWGKNDAASNAVFSVPAQLNKTANAANRTALYGNTTVGAFVTKTAKGQVAVDGAEIKVAGSGKAAAHTGWHLRTVGTGPLESLVITAGGSGYNNTDTITISGGSANGSATMTTNATGGIITVTITANGADYALKNPTVSIANSTGGVSAGTGATLTATAGRRAGRVHMECLAAIGIVGDGVDDAILPNA